MQYGLPFEGISPLCEVHLRLGAFYGPQPITHRLDPVSQLVHSMLGARTRDAITRKVFVALASSQMRWEELIELPYSDFFTLIRNVTFAERKAEFISLALRTIVERRGRLDLDFLSAWPVEASLVWLDALKGVGPKTAAAVLNFSTLHQRALVVDTHYWRVARRLGLIPEKTSLAKAAHLLAQQIPSSFNAADAEINFILMKKLGQEYCRPARPECARCPLRSMCPQASGQWTRRAERNEIKMSVPSHAYGRIA